MNKANSTTAKGNTLEDSFYDYLKGQIDRGEKVLGTHSPDRCKLYRMKAYYCPLREGNINCENVLEIYREGADNPQLTIFFECKNYESSVPETQITDFSNKLNRIAEHNSKGFIVTTSALQSGAQNLCKNTGIGLIRFDPNGSEYKFILERKSITSLSKQRLEVQKNVYSEEYLKPLKFSAFYNGEYFGSLYQLLYSLPNCLVNESVAHNIKVPFVDKKDLESQAHKLLVGIGYLNGKVDLDMACSNLGLSLIHQSKKLYDSNGVEILGNADFRKNQITIFLHNDIMRERFTLAHEIAHFALHHEQYLNSESVTENDLQQQVQNDNQIARLEYQANYFASCLILPRDQLMKKLAVVRQELGIKDRGAGYIYVDDQPCNITTYTQLIGAICEEFSVSRTVAEIKLKDFELLTDNRSFQSTSRKLHSIP
jgi:Zn-dependent peptidase ImmA (M78 family)